MNKSRAKAIFQEIKENSRKLDSCAKHQFGHIAIEKTGAISQQKATCRNCGGSMDIHDITTLAKGYQMAGGNSDDVYTMDWA